MHTTSFHLESDKGTVVAGGVEMPEEVAQQIVQQFAAMLEQNQPQVLDFIAQYAEKGVVKDIALEQIPIMETLMELGVVQSTNTVGSVVHIDPQTGQYGGTSTFGVLEGMGPLEIEPHWAAIAKALVMRGETPEQAELRQEAYNFLNGMEAHHGHDAEPDNRIGDAQSHGRANGHAVNGTSVRL